MQQSTWDNHKHIYILCISLLNILLFHNCTVPLYKYNWSINDFQTVINIYLEKQNFQLKKNKSIVTQKDIIMEKLVFSVHEKYKHKKNTLYTQREKKVWLLYYLHIVLQRLSSLKHNAIYFISYMCYSYHMQYINHIYFTFSTFY